jgi:hypothetical protein
MLNVLNDAHVGAAIAELWMFPTDMFAERGCGSSETVLPRIARIIL